MEYIKMEKEMNSWEIFIVNFSSLHNDLNSKIIDVGNNNEVFTFQSLSDICGTIDDDETCFIYVWNGLILKECMISAKKQNFINWNKYESKK
jgi:hypothetical protein